MTETNDELGGFAASLLGLTDALEEAADLEWPTADTPTGAAQRLRFAVPTPDSVMTIGARGTATSEGRAIGADGFALRTVANYAAEIHGSSIVDIDGLTVTHSLLEARILTQADLGIAAYGGVRVGTAGGDVEVTAGDVPTNDPSFTVVPSMDVPAAPEVDTSTPRSSAEGARTAWKLVTAALKEGARAIRDWETTPNTPSSPSEAPEWARTLSTITNAIAAMRGMYDGMIAPVMAQLAEERGDRGEPKVKIHGAGGVDVTTPSKVSLFGESGVSVDSLYKCTVSGAIAAGLYSPVAAQVYGMAAAKLKSDATATVSGRHAVVKADYAEVRGERVASLSSVDKALVQSKGDVALDAAGSIAMGGDSAHIYGKSALSLGSQRVRATGRERVQLGVGNQPSAMPSKIEMTRSEVKTRVESAEIRLQADSLRLSAGGRMRMDMDGSTVRFAGLASLDVDARETVLRNRVRLG